MQPPRRTRRSTRSYSSVAAAEPSSNRGWLAARRKPSKKRARRTATTIADGEEDDGTPLTDEILVGIFAGLPDLADIVRAAATCRRWRRLVSVESAFISRDSRRTRGIFLRGLALGFFYTHRKGAVPRFTPTASASRRLGLRQPSLNELIDGLDDGLFDSSRLVGSRKGLLVLELKCDRKHVLKLCVCNPMTGEVTVLPPLTGKESLGRYACTVLTAEDGSNDHNRSSYRLVIVYTRRTFTACRSYSSEDGAWGPEAKVTTVSGITQKQMAAMTGAGVVVGNAAYWHARTKVFGLHLDTLVAEHVEMSENGHRRHNPAVNTMLGVSPDGRLRTIQLIDHVPAGLSTAGEQSVALDINTRSAAGGTWDAQEVIPVVQSLPAEAKCVKLRWVGENSGVVYFSAGSSDQTSDVYALNLDKKEIEKLASHQHGGGDSLWGNLHGYEMDQSLYLSSLAMEED
ncbi:hypothetical protein QOZ80_2BG0172670 [Eleusine coracana subsp. coracana]|nr:hypothetical protein QOZ80_2BG0172670 [Eleusine coracana subsp. coracana]